MTHAARRRAIRRRNWTHIAVNLAGLTILALAGVAILLSAGR